LSKLGVVAIGRNEGERLRRCLESVLGRAAAVVYVDSGSQDDSVTMAESKGVETVALDLSTPFTAARARNEGLARLLKLCPDTAYVQFVDGDCEMVDGWLARAEAEMEARPDVAVICGRVRERCPNTVYNRLCDQEWNTPVGETEACGGNSLVRVEAFQQAGGFRTDIRAGEEPELCLRLRARGCKILRIDADMALHDAAMTRFGQWWRRSVRTGYGIAEVSWLHRRATQRVWVRETRSNWFWGLLVPVAALVPAYWTMGLTLLVLLGYPVLGLRIYRGRRRGGDARADAAAYAWFCVVGKFPQMMGQMRFHWERVVRRRRG
jgi:GT2 family glycosyltransferase